MLALGLDASTQSLTAVVIDIDSGAVVHQRQLNYDRDLPQYGTRHGVLPHPDPAIVHAPPLMWVEALDRLLGALGDSVDVARIAAIAGSAQQHGSVYLRACFAERLAALRPERPLVEQLADVCARPTAPVWLDSSTAEDCRALDAALGGPAETQRITGSAAYERFTGPQIRRCARCEPEVWAQTAHVRLVSSFLASLLAGRLADTDWGDASGMNLMDLERKQWHPPALAACAADLAPRLGEPIAPWTVLGPIAPALAARYGFARDCRIVAWTGDNPASSIGLGLVRDGHCAISLGTSDVLFAISSRRPSMPPAGHVFISPTGAYMALFCFANGSLAREAVRDAHHLDWAGFSAALARTPPGNAGRLMLPWFRPEIVPKVLRAGVVRANLSPGDTDADCRAVVEAQFTSMRLRAEAAGLQPTLLHATGGAAQNAAILQVAADVFQCPVRRSQVTNTAALGAALRAAQALPNGPGWDELVARVVEPQLAAPIAPRRDTAEIYRRLAQQYAELEARELAARR
ncbi:MAG: FGGY-family carbohydrate kinase [Planctomycetota bacterium]|nr:FGGY-family carbohydrate kinase [Planctomycetota bacterium]MCX8040164.1 FGGY-family carbohydrate kinase [Planctomycetota bacterium]MDW8372541.1 FGGY-family carbohydrate kinase [Planctomycetota bacterium]